MVCRLEEHLGGIILAHSEDKYYIDYRLGTVVKNLDVGYLAPEMYIEVLPGPVAETYTYTYEDKDGGRLDFMFSAEELDKGQVSFEAMTEAHFSRHNFTPVTVVRRIAWVTEEDFATLVAELS